MEMILGYRVAQAIYVAAALGVADHLTGGPKPADELASLTGGHASSLHRLLRALTSVGLFVETEGGFATTPLGELLTSDHRDSVRPEILYHLDAVCWRPWGELLHAVKTGEPAFQHAFETDPWSYREQHPDVNVLFNDAMRAHASAEREVVLAHCDFQGVGCVVDVGGGTGASLAAVLARHPEMHGILFDQPHVVADADSVLREAGVLERCKVVPGSFLEEVPSGGDLYLLRAVIHNWDDARALTILRSCRRAMAPNARLALVEWLLPAGAPKRTTFLDLHMLVIHGGRERTLAELSQLLVEAGLKPGKAATALGGVSVIEATA
jgi:hypothetical protein